MNLTATPTARCTTSALSAPQVTQRTNTRTRLPPTWCRCGHPSSGGRPQPAGRNGGKASCMAIDFNTERVHQTAPTLNEHHQQHVNAVLQVGAVWTSWALTRPGQRRVGAIEREDKYEIVQHELRRGCVDALHGGGGGRRQQKRDLCLARPGQEKTAACKGRGILPLNI